MIWWAGCGLDTCVQDCFCLLFGEGEGKPFLCKPPISWLTFGFSSGFPPIPGQKAEGAEQGFIAALEAANKIASTDAAEEEDNDDDDDKGEEVGSPSYFTLSFHCWLVVQDFFPAVEGCCPRKCQTAHTGGSRGSSGAEKTSISLTWPNDSEGRPFTCRSASKGKREMGKAAVLFSYGEFCAWSSGSAAGVPGEPEEAVHEGSSAGQAEERHGAGQEPSPHRQRLWSNDRGHAQREVCGHQHGELSLSLRKPAPAFLSLLYL